MRRYFGMLIGCLLLLTAGTNTLPNLLAPRNDFFFPWVIPFLHIRALSIGSMHLMFFSALFSSFGSLPAFNLPASSPISRLWIHPVLDFVDTMTSPMQAIVL